MTSQYFIGGMMPESANRVQERETIIEIGPFRGGWQCYEGPATIEVIPFPGASMKPAKAKTAYRLGYQLPI